MKLIQNSLNLQNAAIAVDSVLQAAWPDGGRRIELLSDVDSVIRAYICNVQCSVKPQLRVVGCNSQRAEWGVL